MQGVEPNSFVIMLQHDPSAWKRSILPKTPAQLTLSGHTHGGQMQSLDGDQQVSANGRIMDFMNRTDAIYILQLDWVDWYPSASICLTK